ncbi:hypothetical protein CBS101457_001480 [Exobasidium rhododendri]|nr:hypothetical protein CBS101457_001480 [Exobasidium rhododendri]
MAKTNKYALIQQDEGEAVFSQAKSFSYLPWLPVTTAALLFFVFSIAFGIPSTLFVYLAVLIVYSTIGVFSIFSRAFVEQQHRRLSFTPMMGIAITLLALPLCIPSSTLPSFPLSRTSSQQSHGGMVLVAANLYNSEKILPRFTASLHGLAELVGKDNIFISIYESNSDDATKSILSQFDNELTQQKIPHRIMMEDTHNHIGVQGNYDRIEFLAHVRNKVYDALDTVEGLQYKSKVTRVIWLNDIIFDPSDALKLLDTNAGNFDVACAIDHVPLGFYDTWVLRDSNLNRVKPLWPYFQDANDVMSLRRGEPIRVKSCWNGMAAFRADLLLDDRPKPFKSESKYNISWPLRFRGSGPCLASECLSIYHDLHQMLANDRDPLIYINPTVKVAYDIRTFFLYNRLSRWRIVDPWQLIWQDWISSRIFGFITDLGRKPAPCKDVLSPGFHAYETGLRHL